jgi:beta-lactam-binding protein with PASTA domain
MKKIAALAVAVLMLTGCASAAKTDPAPSRSVEAAESSAVVVPAVVGNDGKTAKNSLKAAGLDVKFDAGEESVWAASNWTVDEQMPAAGESVAKGSIVTLKVSKPQVAAPAPNPNDVTPSGLDGKAQSPYGWNADFLLDGTHTVAGDTIVLKAGVSITNAYNAEGRFTVDCTVSGTNEAPVIDSFLVY